MHTLFSKRSCKLCSLSWRESMQIEWTGDKHLPFPVLLTHLRWLYYSIWLLVCYKSIVACSVVVGNWKFWQLRITERQFILVPPTINHKSPTWKCAVCTNIALSLFIQDDDSDSSDEDDTAELLAELTKIKKERVAEQAKKVCTECSVTRKEKDLTFPKIYSFPFVL